MVYSDDICLRYIYGFYFSSKITFIYTQNYLKYKVRKAMVGQSEDVPWTFECLVGIYYTFQRQRCSSYCNNSNNNSNNKNRLAISGHLLSLHWHVTRLCCLPTKHSTVYEPFCERSTITFRTLYIR